MKAPNPNSPFSLDAILGADVLPFPAPRPERQHRSPPPVLPLGTRVMARPPLDIAAEGAVYAVTYSNPPRYDVRTDRGRYLKDLPADQVEALP